MSFSLSLCLSWGKTRSQIKTEHSEISKWTRTSISFYSNHDKNVVHLSFFLSWSRLQLIGALYRLATDLKSRKLAIILYKAFVLPIIWVRLYCVEPQFYQMIARISLGTPYLPLHSNYIHFPGRMAILHLPTLNQRRAIQSAIVMLKIHYIVANFPLPRYFIS